MGPLPFIETSEIQNVRIIFQFGAIQLITGHQIYLLDVLMSFSLFLKTGCHADQGFSVLTVQGVTWSFVKMHIMIVS